MKYLSVAETAKRWKMSERSVRNYCAQGRVDGAFLTGKTWVIPEDAMPPLRSNSSARLLEVLQREMKQGVKGGIYHKVQVDLTYNSNHIEGSKLTHDQTRYIFETNTVGVDDALKVDDIVETVNHFRCIDYMLTAARQPLTQKLIKHLHYLLKTSTSDSRLKWFNVGDYKLLPNEVGNAPTSSPQDVEKDIAALLEEYNSKDIAFEDILDFHCKFERIHPFQDGNGRVGRLIMFKECLRLNITPFIIEDELKMFYYRGIKEWYNDRVYLLDTCLTAQDKFKKYLDYFRISYTD